MSPYESTLWNRYDKALTVVGAGPGDPELITRKGARALASAAVVLYDALVDTQLLSHAPQAEHIFVGKRRGCYTYQQDQINDMILTRIRTHGHVVRLKGGDPFVFGRGAEEMEWVASHGYEVRMVPGISSCLSVPAMQEIPVTKRGSAESFWVITGTTRAHKLSEDIALAARSSATVVILMGMARLQEIIELFLEEGKADLPVAVIQEGTTARERTGVGTVNTIEAIAKSKGLSNPAIIIIGEVVKHRERLNILRKQFQVTAL